MSFEAPFPEDFEALAEELNQNSMMYTAPVEEDEFE